MKLERDPYEYMLNSFNIDEYINIDNAFNMEKFDIGSGKSGVVIYYLTMYNATRKKYYFKCVKALLENILSSLPEGVGVRNSFFVETVEFLFLLHLYSNELRPLISDDVVSYLEKMLESYFDYMLSNGNIDGYAGAGYPAKYFFLKRNKKIIDRYCNYIEDKVVWLGAKECVIDIDRRYYGDLIHLGLTHGISNVLSLLCNHLIDYKKKGNIELLSGLKNFVLSNMIDYETHGSYFVDVLGASSSPKFNITYGDLGILYSLLKFAALFHDKDLYKVCKGAFIRVCTEKIPKVNNNSVQYGCTGVYLMSDHLVNDFLDEDFSPINKIVESKHKALLYDKLKEGSKHERSLHFFDGILGEIALSVSISQHDRRINSLFHL